MEENKNFVKEITNIDENIAQWYTDIVIKAELADYTDTKGCIVIRPYGYAIWENIQNYMVILSAAVLRYAERSASRSADNIPERGSPV